MLQTTHPITTDEADLIRFLDAYGAVTDTTGRKHGWLNQRNQPIGALRSLIDKRIAGPLVSTSYPLRVEYQLRKSYKTARQEALAAKERERVKSREYATEKWLQDVARKFR